MSGRFEFRIRARDREKTIDFGTNQADWETTYQSASLVIDREPDQVEGDGVLIGRIVTRKSYARVVAIMVDDAGLMSRGAIRALKSKAARSRCRGSRSERARRGPQAGEMHPELARALKAPDDVRELALGGRMEGDRVVWLTSLPPELARLTNLEKLDLRNHRLTELPSLIGSFAHLTELDLGDSGTLHALPPELGRLQRLRKLVVDAQALTALPSELAALTHLTELWVRGNRLDPFPEVILRLGALERLNVGDNPLRELPRDLGRLAALRYLGVGGTEIRELPPSIGELTALEELEAPSTALTALPREVGRLRRLRRIDLRSGGRLSSLPAEVGQLSSLEVLLLDGNRLADLPAELVVLPSLRFISAADNGLRSLGRLAEARALKKLYVDGNRIPPSEIDAFRAARPDVDLRSG